MYAAGCWNFHIKLINFFRSGSFVTVNKENLNKFILEVEVLLRNVSSASLKRI